MKLTGGGGVKRRERRTEGEEGGEEGEKGNSDLFLVFADCSLRGRPERRACNYSARTADSGPGI